MKKILVVLCLVMLVVGGCATNGVKTDPSIVTGKTLLATKQTIINVHESFRVPCKEGIVSKQDCGNVDKLTTEAGPIYDAAVDAAVLSLHSGDNTNALLKQQALERLLGDMIALTIKYSIKPEGAK